MKCPRCQKEIQDDDALFCPHCGLKLEKCPVCHQPLVKGSKFCSHCGTQLNQSHQESQIGGYYQPIQTDQPQMMNQYLNTNQQVNTNQQSTTPFKEVEVNKNVNKKIIIIAVAILIVLSVVSFGYLIFGPSLNLGDSASNNGTTELNPNIQLQEKHLNPLILEI